MDKQTYSEKLKDPRWHEKRWEILKRDKEKCTQCGKKHDLEVHHLFYLDGRDPWDYSNECLKTLCDRCHRQWHFDQERCETLFLQEFYKKGFAPHQMLDLVSAFGNCQLPAPNLLMPAIELLLTNKKVQITFLSDYFGQRHLMDEYLIELEQNG